METIKTPEKYVKNSKLISVDFDPTYIISLTTPTVFNNIIVTRALACNVEDFESYIYLYSIKINMKGNISITREGGKSTNIDIVEDYEDSISNFIHVIREIYAYNIKSPYFTLSSLSKVIHERIMKIFQLPVEINNKFVKCNYDTTVEYASELISRLIVKYCKENKNESNNENV